MESTRAHLLSDLPTDERRVSIAGVSTAVLEGGEGPPIVLLHEPGSFAAHWARILRGLMGSCRVVAPDLPGHGASEVTQDELDRDRFLAWTGELIERTCDDPPALVGHLGSGALAARFAAANPDLIRALVLVDSFGLGKFRPSPRFAIALFRYVARPTPGTYDGLMQRCTADYDGLRAAMGERWKPFEDYTLDRARSAAGKTALKVLMREIAVPAIPPDELSLISVPTTLIWGRNDPVNRLRVAEAASERYGWPLRVVEDAGDDAPLERPEEFLRALHAAPGVIDALSPAR